MKRLIAMTCVLVMLMVFAGNVFALDVVDNEYDILESAAHEEIERLYSLRGQLCFNYEENVDTIKIIDEQLVLLGVVELTETEALGIMGIDAEPLVSLPSESNVKWTSERSYTVTNGLEVEYQIIRAVLDGPGGALQSSAAVTIEYDQPIQADLLEIGQLAVKEYAAPLIGMAVDATYGPIIRTIDEVVSFFDMCSDINEELTETTIIPSVQCTYTMSFVAEEKYIYVKYRGALDAGNQVLCYAGNKVQYEAVYAVPTVLMSSDGSYVPHVETEIITGVQQSDNYDSALGYAVTNFFYKIHLDEDPFIVYMIIQSFTVTGLEEVTEFRTPRSKCALV